MFEAVVVETGEVRFVVDDDDAIGEQAPLLLIKLKKLELRPPPKPSIIEPPDEPDVTLKLLIVSFNPFNVGSNEEER